jgi:hypothetical protein
MTVTRGCEIRFWAENLGNNFSIIEEFLVRIGANAWLKLRR